jgi:predicted AAA+ superfamily ATPase
MVCCCAVIARAHHLRAVVARLRSFPVVAILGARQIGKTTLAEQVASSFGQPAHRFDLEDPADLGRLDDPRLALAELRGLVILDEVQRRPDLFPVLRVLADRRPRPARFLILGSASPGLLRQSSETLAGRIAYYSLPGLSLAEVGIDELRTLWLRGGFPLAFLARSHGESALWRRQFIDTFLQRDLPELGVRIPSTTLRRFWFMLAHWHAQVWNGSEFGRSFGVSDTTVRRYLDLLSAALVVRQLPPWHANISKRQVKAPKVFVRDSGILHALLGIESRLDLERHPKVGGSWEGFVLEQLLTRLEIPEDRAYFWRTHTGAELDLLVDRGRRRFGYEIKRMSAPRLTPSMRSAVEDLALEELVVIHAGEHSYPISKRVRAVAASRLLDDL